MSTFHGRPGASSTDPQGADTRSTQSGHRLRPWLLAASLATLLTGCPRPAADRSEPPPTVPVAAPPVSPPPPLGRRDFNRLAARNFLPLFWRQDVDGDGVIDPDELAILWGMGEANRSDWVEQGSFTSRFAVIYQQLLAQNAAREVVTSAGLAPREQHRRELVVRELDQARPALVYTSFQEASDEDRAIVEHVMRAAAIIERVYLAERGASGMAAGIPGDDPASRMLFYRNQGPWCAAPQTENEPDCNALPSFPPSISGLYPASLQSDPAFCKTLAERPDGEKLLHQFFVVREQGGDLAPVPYHVAFREPMAQVAGELRAAAEAVRSPSEAAFRAYLQAAAKAFVDDSWEQADEAWAKMNAENSRFYLRIGPDEVYFEPCSRKAGFHVSFALINQGSLEWQRKLEPVKNDLEKELARLAGPPYAAREVSFHLPDFIDIVLNAGDSRDPFGATIGQSLPNWGPVANEGRGRTVVMTNLYTDTDSEQALTDQASSLLCAPSMRWFTTDAPPFLLSTVLHEAAHNLGPSHEYRVGGKKASELFGGQLASTMEELKAQSSALHLAGWLGAKGIIDPKLVEHSHVRDIIWAFGHISRGMYGPSGERKPYSQLAAIQLGMLLADRAILWQPEVMAHNGRDKGCFELHLERFPRVSEKMLETVARLLARGDVDAAKQIVERYVDKPADGGQIHEVIRQRWQRAPVASFVYSVDR